MLDLEVSQAPDISALHYAQQMQSLDCLPVPVQVWEEEKALITSLAEASPVNDIFDLLAPLDNVEDPIESALVSFCLHVWPDPVPVDPGCFCHESDPLFAVFLDVLLRARIDQVDLQVGEVVMTLCVSDGATAGHVPVVDVIGAQILECAKATGYRPKVIMGVGKRGALKDQQSWLPVDGAEERGSPACLVWSERRPGQIL